MTFEYAVLPQTAKPVTMDFRMHKIDRLHQESGNAEQFKKIDVEMKKIFADQIPGDFSPNEGVS